MTIYAYEADTGRIQFTYDAPYPEGYDTLLDNAGVAWIEGPDGLNIMDYWISDGGPVAYQVIASQPSKTVITDDGLDAAEWVDLPAGAIVYVDGVEVHRGSSFSLSSDEEGLYEVRITAPGHHPQQTTIGVQ